MIDKCDANCSHQMTDFGIALDERDTAQPSEEGDGVRLLMIFSQGNDSQSLPHGRQ